MPDLDLFGNPIKAEPVAHKAPAPLPVRLVRLVGPVPPDAYPYPYSEGKPPRPFGYVRVAPNVTYIENL